MDTYDEADFRVPDDQISQERTFRAQAVGLAISSFPHPVSHGGMAVGGVAAYRGPGAIEIVERAGAFADFIIGYGSTLQPTFERVPEPAVEVKAPLIALKTVEIPRLTLEAWVSYLTPAISHLRRHKESEAAAQLSRMRDDLASRASALKLERSNADA